MSNDFDFGQGDLDDGNPIAESSPMRSRLSEVGVLFGMVALVVAVLALLSSLDIDAFSQDQAGGNSSSQPGEGGSGGGNGKSGDLGRKPSNSGGPSGGAGALGGLGGGPPVAVDDIVIKNGESGGVIGRWHTGVAFSGDESGWLNLRPTIEPMTGLLNRFGAVRNGTEASALSSDVAVTMHPDGTITITKNGELIGLLTAIESDGELTDLESVGDVTLDADSALPLAAPGAGGRINQTDAQIFDLGDGRALVTLEDGSTVVLEPGEAIRFNADGSHDVGKLGEEGFNVGVDESGDIQNDADVDITEGWSAEDQEKWSEAAGDDSDDQAQASPDDESDEDNNDDDKKDDDSGSLNIRPLLYGLAALAAAVVLFALVRFIRGLGPIRVLGVMGVVRALWARICEIWTGLFNRTKTHSEGFDEELLGEDEPAGPPVMQHEDLIRSSLEEQIRAITLAEDPRMAIQQAYMLAEGGFGVPALSRRPSESPGEFVHRCVGGFGQPSALRELVRLFEIARYSREPVTEAMRSDARNALITLKDAVGTDDRVVL